jgi:hypothetical protein
MTGRAINDVVQKEKDGSVSFYFFDIDDNLLFLSTTIILTNADPDATEKKREVSTGDFATIEPQLGQPGKWETWHKGPDAFRNFSDRPGASPAESPFVQDVKKAIDGCGEAWMGPSFKFWTYACEKGRPTAYITARGHEPASIEAGLGLLAEHAGVPAPRLLAIYPTSNPTIEKALGGGSLGTPLLKRRAIKQAVAEAYAQYGDGPPHRFGMSDDDPRNVLSLIAAMTDCKKQRPDKRFFVIDTHRDEHVKLEVLSMDHPAPRSETG